MKQTLSVVAEALQNAVESGLIGQNEMGTHGCMRPRPAGTILAIKKGKVAEVLNTQQLKLLENEGLILPQKTARCGAASFEAVVIAWDALLNRVSVMAETEALRHNAEARARRARKELDAVRTAQAADRRTAAVLESMLEEARKMRAETPAVMEFSPTARNEQRLAGIPTLMVSDLHYGENVDPTQIQGLNTYNVDIAKQRLNRLFSNASDLLLTHLSGSYYDGLVVSMGGDMVSGNIHEEIQRTNDVEMLQACVDLSKHLASGLRMLAKEFPLIRVPCVVGNHGRMERKPTAKGKSENNFDQFMYHFLLLELRDVPNVHLHITNSADYDFKLYETRYRLTHGDQFKGGAGVGGIWPSLFKGDLRKRKRDGYDYLELGHFHQYGIINNIIVNGSLKGYDEYAYLNNFDFQRAMQALWVTHPRYGMTIQMPVICDEESEIRQRAETDTFSMGSFTPAVATA